MLAGEQEAAIQKMLIDKAPQELKLSSAFWTRDAVRLAIKNKYGLELPLRTITDYLKRWGFTPQKPATRPMNKNPEKVQQWLEEGYPDIAARARKEGAEVPWGDETGVTNEAAYNVRGFSPKGKTPVVELNASRSSINMISSIDQSGQSWTYALSREYDE